MDAIRKDIERDAAKVKRSKKAAKQFLVALGLMTPTGRPSKAKPRRITKIW